MKNKNQNVIRRKREFRYHNVTMNNKKGKRIKKRHPTYVFLEKGNVYVYVSITHSRFLNDFVLIKFRKNPNPNDSRDSYWIADKKEDKKDTFGRRQKGWKIDSLDDEDIRKR